MVGVALDHARRGVSDRCGAMTDTAMALRTAPGCMVDRRSGDIPASLGMRRPRKRARSSIAGFPRKWE